MKKTIILFLMLLILLGTSLFAGIMAAALDPQEPRPEFSQKVENPVPPNLENLKMLDMEPFVSNLPVVMIDTCGQQIVKEEMKAVRTVIFEDPSGKNDILSRADTVMNAGLKLRGASSYNFDKNQYRLKFYQEKSLKKPLGFPFLHMNPDSEWVLHGPCLDHSLLRNYLMYQLSGEIMEWAPDCRFLELFVDGNYQGVYLAVEPITVSSSRLHLSPFGLLSGACPYVIIRDRIGTEPNSIETYGSLQGFTGNQLSVRYPTSQKLTDRQKLWISEDVSRFEMALYSDHFDDPETGYARYIDIDCFTDYVILNEISLNHDAGNLSTCIYKDLGGRLKLSVWDFNNSFDNYQWFHCPADQFQMTENFWFDRMLQDRNFVDRVVNRYQQLRRTTLSDAHMQQLLFTGRQQLGPAISRNYCRWGYLFSNPMLSSQEGIPDRNPENYAQAFNRLLLVMKKRTAFLDQHITDLYDGCIN